MMMMMMTTTMMMMITATAVAVNSRLYAPQWRRPRTGGYIQFDLENE
jgi:hypothetical protein